MALTVQRSLFEGGVPMVESAGWIESVMLSEIAVGLCVISVGLVGVRMLTGRLPLRQGMQVVIGCFVLLGAPIIAAGLLDLGARSSPEKLQIFHSIDRISTRAELTEANYNPYAQASVQNNQPDY